jgi:hypothetical protein
MTDLYWVLLGWMANKIYKYEEVECFKCYKLN